MGCFCGAAVVATDPATLGAGESIFQGIILFLNFLQKFRFIGHYSVENSSNLPNAGRHPGFVCFALIHRYQNCTLHNKILVVLLNK